MEPTMIAITFVLSLTLQEPRTQPPVTIEVTQDVSVEPYRKEREGIRGILQFFNNDEPVVIRRGQRFQMVKRVGQMEGGCRIRVQRKDYEVASCFWRDGFRDNQSDIFVVQSRQRQQGF